MLVPGARQAAFMHRLGFKHVITGFYAADDNVFRPDVPVTERQRAFLFLGRIVNVKGIAILVEAYKRYRSVSSIPWELHVIGTGPLARLCEGLDGLSMIGFAQPQELPSLLNQYRCLILPSLFEPWGVVVHEAVLAGLTVVTSEACGAGSFFVRHGWNGFISPVTPDEICQYMLRLEGMTAMEWEAFSARSVQIGRSWTLNNLVDLFVHEFIKSR
jgi:glycosyltransferase involved in cell wall biosynthesis